MQNRVELPGFLFFYTAITVEYVLSIRLETWTKESNMHASCKC